MIRIMEEVSAEKAASGALGAGPAGVGLALLDGIRWVAILGQAASLLATQLILGFPVPLELALPIVAASALINIGNIVLRRTTRRLSEREATLFLGYDILQLGLLLYLTGGLENPFAILMVAPVTVAATILSRESVIVLSL